MRVAGIVTSAVAIFYYSEVATLYTRSRNLVYTVAIYYLTVDTLLLRSGGYPPPSRNPASTQWRIPATR